jgi:hypothetical protein
MSTLYVWERKLLQTGQKILLLHVSAASAPCAHAGGSQPGNSAAGGHLPGFASYAPIAAAARRPSAANQQSGPAKEAHHLSMPFVSAQAAPQLCSHQTALVWAGDMMRPVTRSRGSAQCSIFLLCRADNLLHRPSQTDCLQQVCSSSEKARQAAAGHSMEGEWQVSGACLCFIPLLLQSATLPTISACAAGDHDECMAALAYRPEVSADRLGMRLAP